MPPKIKNLKAICKYVEDLARKSYKPVIDSTASNDKESFIESKFGGKPFISKEKYPWPLCECGNKEKFFLQLNSDTMPSHLKVNENYFDGLLQFFYCTDCSDYKPFSKSHHLRTVNRSDLNEPQAAADDEGIEQFPYKRISDWTEETDFMHQTELCDNEELIGDNYDALEYVSENYKTLAGEKFLGWPDWVQDPEYPECRKCKKPMKFLFQVDSENNIPFMWGDFGCGHISQCPEHKEEIAFTWACH